MMCFLEELKSNSITLMLFLAFTSTSVNAQKKYSLSDCVDYGLANFETVNIARNNKQMAVEDQKQALSAYLPQVSGSWSTVDNLKLQTTIIPAGVFSEKEMDLKFGKQYVNSALVDLSQSIYDQSKLNNIKTKKISSESADVKERQNNEQIIFNTTQAYLQVLTCDVYLNTLNDDVDTYKQLYKIINLQYSKGVALETDLDRIHVNLQSTEYQRSEMETQRNNALNNLKFYMGFPRDSVLSIDTTMDFTSFASLPESGNDFNYNNLSEYKLNKINADLLQMNIQNAKASYLPSVNFVGRLGTQSMDDNFGDSFGKWHDYSYVGVSVNVPIFYGLKRNSLYRQSILGYENAVENLELTRKSSQLQYDNSRKSLITAFNNYQNNKSNMELAKKIFDKTNLSYQRGVVALTDFLNDDTALKNAQANYVNSLFAYMTAKLNYENSKGTLLNFYNQLKK